MFHWRPFTIKCTVNLQFVTYGRCDQRSDHMTSIYLIIYYFCCDAYHLTPARVYPTMNIEEYKQIIETMIKLVVINEIKLLVIQPIRPTMKKAHLVSHCLIGVIRSLILTRKFIYFFFLFSRSSAAYGVNFVTTSHIPTEVYNPKTKFDGIKKQTRVSIGQST